MSGRRPIAGFAAWLWLWWLAVALVWLLCLLPPPPLPQLPDGSDKWQHALAYFLLAGSGVQLWRGWRALGVLGLGLALMGIAIELAQGLLTAQRQADGGDVLANLAGIAAGLLLAFTPLGSLLARWFPQARQC